MELSLSIHYEVDDPDPEIEKALEEIIAEEARGFGETIRRRLAAAGIENISMKLTDNP